MKKALILLVLLPAVFLLVGCEEKYTPDPEVEQYLNTGLTPDKAFEKISAVSYTTTNIVRDADGNQTGQNVVYVHFDVSDEDCYVYSNRQTYDGIYIRNNVKESVSSVSKDGENYLYTTVKTYVDGSNDVNEQNIDKTFVHDLIRSHVFTQNGVYAEGGLYFGDYFMQYIYRYPAEAFYIDHEQNLCVFDAVIDVNNSVAGRTFIKQNIKINALGLITYYYEQNQSAEERTTLTSETIPQYVFVPEDN